MREFLRTWWSIEPMVQLIIPVFLLSYRLPRRQNSQLRAIGAFTILLAIAIVPLAAWGITGLDVGGAFVVFSTLIAVFVGAILFIFDVRPWTALFCATAGYTLQNIASGLIELIRMTVTGRSNVPLDEPLSTIVSIGVPFVIYLAGYWLFVRRVTLRGLLDVENRLMLSMFAIVVVVVIGLDLIIKALTIVGIPFRFLLLLRLVHPLVCVFVLFAEYELLYAKRADDERAETERLLAERERQYRLSRENIEAINIKCHDIKHQIRTLASGGAAVDARVLDDIEREVSVYDSAVKTGNEALDTILTEKGLLCERRGITLTCIADGSALAGMAPADLYALFGNALDNAIEAVSRLDDPARRSISLTVRAVVGVAAIHVENYCDDALVMGTDGLPETTKGDRANHGFGTRSMRQIAERYGGSFSAVAEGGAFKLDVMIPLP